MSRAVWVWCEEDGQDLRSVANADFEDLTALADDADLAIVGAFTISDCTAFAVTNISWREAMAQASRALAEERFEAERLIARLEHHHDALKGFNADAWGRLAECG